LLDAGLLAEVYLRMTRGQGSLVIDESGSSGPVRGDERVDLRALALPVLRATDEEQAAHEAMLADLDKASGGKTLWRQQGGVPA
jgi:DNA polymerase-3 subunit epsilon